MREQPESWIQKILMRMFGRPQGLLGRIGGFLLALEKGAFIPWLIDHLQIEAKDHVLEVGFGPGVAIDYVVKQSVAAKIAGVDYSQVMVQQAIKRNAQAIASGKVDLRYGSAEALPFADGSFDCAFSINSMQLWPSAADGLAELARVLKPGGRLVLGFTAHSGQAAEPLPTLLEAAGFTSVHLDQNKEGFCLVASKA